MEKLYTVNKNNTWNWLWLRSSASHSKIQALKKKKTNKRKNPRPARYDLNQIQYEFSVGAMNRFKGLYLDNSVLEKLWTVVCNTVQKAANNTIQNKPKIQATKAKTSGITNKLKSFGSTKEITNWMYRTASYETEIFVNWLSYKVLISKICKTLIELNNTNNNPILKIGRGE